MPVVVWVASLVMLQSKDRCEIQDFACDDAADARAGDRALVMLATVRTRVWVAFLVMLQLTDRFEIQDCACDDAGDARSADPTLVVVATVHALVWAVSLVILQSTGRFQIRVALAMLPSADRFLIQVALRCLDEGFAHRFQVSDWEALNLEVAEGSSFEFAELEVGTDQWISNWLSISDASHPSAPI